MPAPAHLALLALLAAFAPGLEPKALAQKSLPPEPSGLLEAAREAALRYSDSLPDFICTELIHRSEDPGNSRWRPVDRLTVKLSYFGRREDYKLMEINGKPTLLEYLYVGGALSTGEFGTRLYMIFDPDSKTGFQWKGWANLRKRRAAVFGYRVTQQDSSFRIQYGDSPEGPNAIVVGYRGEVFVDEETHMVLRVTQFAEIPPSFPIQQNTSSIDYEFVDVGGREFLLPTHAQVKTKSGRYVAENDVEFRGYRKFHTETTITFDAPEVKK